MNGFSGAGMSEVVNDGRVWSVRAIVAVHEGDDSHWGVNDDGDVEVSVEAVHGGGPLTTILVAAGGGGGRGYWAIPPVGAEVVVEMPEDFEGDAYLVGAAASRQPPDGLTADRAVLVAPELRITATGGNVDLRGDEVHVGGGGAMEPTVKGATYRSAEDAMLSALSSAVALISNIPGLTPPQLAIVTAATAAISAFQSSSSSYLTTIAKVR